MKRKSNKAAPVPFHRTKFIVPADQAPAVGALVTKQSLHGTVVHIGQAWAPGPNRGFLFSVLDESTGDFSRHGHAGAMRPGSKTDDYADVVEYPDNVEVCYIYVK